MLKIKSTLKILTFLFGVIPAIAWTLYGTLLIISFWNSIESYWIVTAIYSGAILGSTGLVMSLITNNIYVNWVKSFLILIGVITIIYIYIIEKSYNAPIIWEQMTLIMPIFAALTALIKIWVGEVDITITVIR